MKKFILILVIALLLGTALGLGVQHDLGYIRVSFGHWLIETNFWVGVACLLLLILLINTTLAVLRRLSQGGSAVNSWLSRSSQRRAQKRTTQGLLALAEGNWPRARKFLESSASHAETPLINYLAAAQAASEEGDYDDADSLLRAAYESTPGSDLAVGLTQAQLQMAANHYEQALATLLRLRKQAPGHPFVLKLLKAVYVKLEDWRELASLLPELRKRGLVSSDELTRLERKVWHNLMQKAADECRRVPETQRNLDKLTRIWDELPGTMRKDSVAIRDYAQLLADLGDQEQAEALLRKVLRNHWSDELVNLYGRLQGQSVEEQLLSAERWLQDRPNNPELLLALGRLSLRNELWGKAREYFETSLRLKRSHETMAELSRLNAHMGHDEKSRELLIQSLLKDSGLPELPMPKH